MMDVSKFQHSLKTQWLGKKINLLPQVDSTNLWAKRELEKGTANRGDLFLTSHQTAGRGRLNRSWVSEPGNDILVTFIDTFPTLHDFPFQLSLLTGLSLYQGLKKIYPNLEFSLKWPNDLLLDGKKLGGVLCESFSAAEKVIVGLGINVNGDYSSLLPHSTSLRQKLKTPLELELILKSLLESYEALRTQFDQNGFAGLAPAWEKAASCWGRKVHIENPPYSFSGTLIGLDERGFLLVENNGTMQAVITGDVIYDTSA